MKLTISFILVIFSTLCWSQEDNTWFFGVNGKITDSQSWRIKKKLDFRKNKRVWIKTYQKEESSLDEKLLFSEKIKVESESRFFIKIKGKVFSNGLVREFEQLNNGRYKFFDYENGKIRRAGITMSKIPLIFEGEVSEFYLNGNTKSISVYKNNELISNKNWLPDGSEYVDNIFYSVDEEPFFPRGMGYLHSHILNTFKNSGLDISQADGTIKLGFVVMEDGRINGIRVLEGMNSALNDLALKAFNSLLGQWEPAKLNDKNVRYFQIFPINFIYTEYDFDYVDLRGSMLYWEIN